MVIWEIRIKTRVELKELQIKRIKKIKELKLSSYWLFIFS